MEKKQLTGFIDKYHLAGNANSVRLDVKDKTLSCNFITDDQNVVGSVSMNNFDVEDVTLGVYATSQLTKLLTALDNDVTMRINNADGTAFSINLSDKTTDVTFMLADLSVIRQVPAMKQLPDFNMILNYSTLNTNRITWPTSIEGEQSDLKATCFSANLFKEILVANKEAETGYIEVSSAGLARVSFTGKDYSSTYYLVQLQAN